MAHKVYISPSLQPWNLYADGSGSEQYHMQAVGRLVVELLEKHQQFVVYSNRPGMTLQQAIDESNELAVDAHVAIHSNAGTGKGAGTEIWIVEKGYRAEKLAKAIYRYLAPLSPGEDRGIKESSYYGEVRETNAPAIIVETEFHDDQKLAQWIGQNHGKLAQAIYRGICEYFEVTPIEPRLTEVIQVEVRIGNKIYHGKLKESDLNGDVR